MNDFRSVKYCGEMSLGDRNRDRKRTLLLRLGWSAAAACWSIWSSWHAAFILNSCGLPEARKRERMHYQDEMFLLRMEPSSDFTSKL